MRSLFRSTFLISAVLLSACTTLGEPSFLRFDTVDGASAYERGRDHFVAGRFGLAVDAFERAVSVDAASIEALNGLAASYDRIGRFDLAQRHYERALRLDPMSVQTLNNIGYSYFMQGRYDVAAVFLQDAYWLQQEEPIVRGNYDLVEQALSDTAEPEQSLLAIKPPRRAPVAVATPEAGPQLRIVRTSRREQLLIKSSEDTAIAHATRDRPGSPEALPLPEQVVRVSPAAVEVSAPKESPAPARKVLPPEPVSLAIRPPKNLLLPLQGIAVPLAEEPTAPETDPASSKHTTIRPAEPLALPVRPRPSPSVRLGNTRFWLGGGQLAVRIVDHGEGRGESYW